jgi:hypothetical protein
LCGGDGGLSFGDGLILGTERSIHQTQEPRIARLGGELSSQFLDGSGFPLHKIKSTKTPG